MQGISRGPQRMTSRYILIISFKDCLLHVPDALRKSLPSAWPSFKQPRSGNPVYPGHRCVFSVWVLC